MNWKGNFPKENRYFETENGILYCGNVLDILKEIPDESIDCIITSPPYWGLRFYGNDSNTIWGGDKKCEHEFDNQKINIHLSMSDKSKLCNGKGANPKQQNLDGEYISGYCKKCGAWYGQLGLEPDFNQYLDNLIEIFKECKRILKPTGTLFVNISDTYFSKSKGSGGNKSKKLKVKGKDNFQSFSSIFLQNEYPEKSLCMIPERFAMRMIDELGFILRNKIIWEKPNAMPESVKDRFTKSYEFIYFFTKNKKYTFNQILEPYTQELKRWGGEKLIPKGVSSWDKGTMQKTYRERSFRPNPEGRNKRDVWNIPTRPLKEEHFAPFPVDIPLTCIKAGTNEYVCSICGSGRELIKIRKEVDCNEVDCNKENASSGKVETCVDNDKDNWKVYDYSPYCRCGNNKWDKAIVLDIFMGSGTTAIASEKINRRWIGIEINERYCEIAKNRFLNELNNKDSIKHSKDKNI